MSGLRDRHLVGGAAAACAVCCAAPVIGFLGVAGFAATAVTLAFAGVVFAVVVGLAAVAAVLVRRSRRQPCQLHRSRGDRASGRRAGSDPHERHQLTGATEPARCRLGDCCP